MEPEQLEAELLNVRGQLDALEHQVEMVTQTGLQDGDPLRYIQFLAEENTLLLQYEKLGEQIVTFLSAYRLHALPNPNTSAQPAAGDSSAAATQSSTDNPSTSKLGL